ncbi:hypothetical protein GTP23_17690 [Pseudoduganella sp. FT93W]|uniref:DUF2189 domain-containing protein n=1 Tax=Duganella fentianensis TaxID=2692177 RepID=A0A845I3M0_9BURK|nr:BPSS1780 family membrane protein [Duganella fentianensis]MYN46877.1 hypothetical protein [Duganella fentianensis]
MNRLPMRAGFGWVKQGWQLFRKQPGGLMALFFCCMFLSMFTLFVPLLGSIAPTLLAPMFTVALLQACTDVDQGQRSQPRVLFNGFRQPARHPLLGMGLVYLLLMMVALAILSLLDDGNLIRMAAGEVPMDEAMLEQSRGPLFLGSLIYMLGWLLTCLTAPLIYWQKMTLGKALFFSVMTVARDFRAFFGAALLLFMLFQVGTALPVLLLSSPQLKLTTVFAIFLVLVVLLHCTLYACYRHYFGTPAATTPSVPLR